MPEWGSFVRLLMARFYYYDISAGVGSPRSRLCIQLQGVPLALQSYPCFPYSTSISTPHIRLSSLSPPPQSSPLAGHVFLRVVDSRCDFRPGICSLCVSSLRVPKSTRRFLRMYRQLRFNDQMNSLEQPKRPTSRQNSLPVAFTIIAVNYRRRL